MKFRQCPDDEIMYAFLALIGVGIAVVVGVGFLIATIAKVWL